MSDTRCQECGRWECVCVEKDRTLRAALDALSAPDSDPPYSGRVYDTRRPAVLAKLAHALDLALIDYATTQDMQRLRDALVCWEAWEILDREET